jgi:hypothetical protein
MSNLLVLPGLGSITAGHRRRGYVQVVLSLAGLAMTLAWCVWFFSQWLRLGEMPVSFGPYLWICLAGIALFLIGWLWALGTSLAILRTAYSLPDTPSEARAAHASETQQPGKQANM